MKDKILKVFKNLLDLILKFGGIVSRVIRKEIEWFNKIGAYFKNIFIKCFKIFVDSSLRIIKATFSFSKRKRKLTIFVLIFLLLFLSAVIFINGVLNQEGPITSTEIPVNSVVLEVENKTIYLEEVGETYQLEAVVYPLNAHNKNVMFTSSNEKVVSVSENGVVTLLRLRNADEEDIRITVETIDGGYKDTVKVIVPVYTDYAEMIRTYVDDLEISLTNINKKLFNSLQIVISDEIKVESIVDALSLTGVAVNFNWRVVEGDDVIRLDNSNMTTGEALFKPITTGDAIIELVCLYENEEILTKQAQVKVVLTDVLNITYTGLNESYYQGESINNSNIVLNISYRDSYGNLNERNVNYDKVPNYVLLTTIKDGNIIKEFVYEGYTFVFEYFVEKADQWDLKIEGFKRKYVTSDNLLNLKVVVTADDKEFKYSLYELQSNVRDIDMKVSGEKELIIYHMDKEYKFYFSVVSDECTIEISGLNKEYPVNSKILYDNIQFKLTYVNKDYYQDKIVNLTDYYSQSQLDSLFNNQVIGHKEVKLNINNQDVIVSYDVINEITNVKELELLSVIKDEYLVNDPFTLLVNPVYNGYVLDFNKNDLLILLDGVIVSENEITTNAGVHNLEIQYGDYTYEKKIEVLCKLTVNYYLETELKETQIYKASLFKETEYKLPLYTGYEVKSFKLNSGTCAVLLNNDSTFITMLDDSEEANIDIIFTVKTYTITYKVKGELTVIHNFKYKDNVTPYQPEEKEGYVFAGWDVVIPDTMPSYDIVANGKYESSENTIYYIKYFTKNHNVENYIETCSFNSDILAKFDVEYNGVVSIKLLNGKTVLYSTTYNPSGYTYSHYEIKGEECLVYYTANKHKLTYIIDDDIFEYEYSFGETISEFKEIKEGYTVKWHDLLITEMPDNNVVIKGSYVPLEYNLTLVDGDNIIKYLVDCGDTLILPTLKDGINTFEGWFDREGHKYETMPAFDLTLFSKWTINKKVVSFTTVGLENYYLIGSEIDVNNIYVKFIYEDNSEETIKLSELNYSGDFDTSVVSIKNIIINHQNQTFKFSYEVTNVLKEILSVNIEGFPGYFYLGDTYDLSNYYLVITFTTETVRIPLNDVMFNGLELDLNTIGHKNLIITYYSEVISISYDVVNPIIIANSNVLTLFKEYSFIVNVDPRYVNDNYQLSIPTSADYEVKYSKNENGSFTVNVTLRNNSASLEIGLEGIPCKQTINLQLINVDELEFIIKGNDYIILNKSTSYNVVAYYNGVGYSLANAIYEWTLEGGNASGNGNAASVILSSTGKYVLKVSIFIDGKTITLSKNIECINPYTGLSILEDKYYGIGEVLTLSGFKYNSSMKKVANTYSFKAVNKSGTLNNSLLKWYTSDEKIASFGLNGELNINGNGYVTIYVTSKVAYDYNLVDNNYVGSFTVKCVYDAVLVSNYEQIKKAFSDKQQVVLNNNIDIGPEVMKLETDSNGNVIRTKLDSVSNPKYLINNAIGKIASTWDCNYLLNINNTTVTPTLNYCLEITNNLYGNGYVLDCYQITTASAIDRNINYFNGPLNLVSLMDAAAVKGQDNIGFLVRSNVTIDNVILQNCDDGYLYRDNMFVYSQLEKVGTTVEVMGDNVSILNSRLKNGRNVLRIYGTENENEKINVRIESSIIANAREFLVKIGVNKAIKSNAKVDYNGNIIDVKELYNIMDTIEVSDYVNATSERRNLLFSSCSPYLYQENGEKYNPHNDKNQLDEYFINNYLMHEVTLKNSVLVNTGFFAVGLESKFAGPILGGFRYAPKGLDFSKGYNGVYDISGTSYASLLKLEGDVRIYNWKKLDDIDSSSIMEQLAYAKILEQLGYDFKFDVKQLIMNVSQEKGYESIINKYNGDTYAHGGIVLYGGGRNYHMVNLDNYSGKEFTQYIISSNKLGDGLFAKVLPWAGGNEPFRFFMFDSNSEFNYEYQKEELESGKAYSWIEPVK